MIINNYLVLACIQSSCGLINAVFCSHKKEQLDLNLESVEPLKKVWISQKLRVCNSAGTVNIFL